MKIALALILLLLTGCDASTPPVAAPATQQQTATLEITTLNRLEANRAIQLAVGNDGAIWWTQRSDETREAVYCQERSGLPRATELTTRTILSRLGFTSGDGRIAGLAAVEGGCVFYFVGGSGIEPIAMLARFDLQTRQITTLCDYMQLSKLTGLGRTIELAEVSLVRRDSRATLWLWLADSSQFLDVPLDSADAPARVAFTTLYNSGLPLQPKPQTHRLASGWKSDRLLLTQLSSKEVLSIDSVGMCERVGQNTLPIGLPTNAAATANGRAMVFLAQSKANTLKPDEALDPTLPSLPALLIFSGGDSSIVPLGQLVAHQGFPTYALQLQSLVADPTQPNEFIAFDLTSGELLRLILRD